VKTPHVHIPFDKIEHYATLLKQQKFDLEIYFSAHTIDISNVGQIAERIEDLEYGPSLSIHAPFMDLSPAAVDPMIRDVTMLRFGQVMDIASAIKPKRVVFHSGYEKWKYALDVELWLEKSLITWNTVLDRAVSIGTRLAIENIF
jgi:endonuclease IV